MSPWRPGGRHSRDRIAFWIAVATSAAVHLGAVFTSPHFVSSGPDVAVARYDAWLLPPGRELLAAAAAPRPTAPKPRAVRTTPPRATTAAPPAAPSDQPPEAAATAAEPPSAGEAIAPVSANPVTTKDPEPVAAMPPVPVEAPLTAPAADVVAAAAPELPERISISYKATSSISDGVADYSWKRTGKKYEVDSSLQASGFVVALFAGILHQVSSGEISTDGLEPERFMMRRGDAQPETAEFLRGSNELRLTRGGNARMLPLPPRLQDTQSFLFQLAFDAPRLKSQDARLEVLVTNARKVYRHQFRQLGETAVETRFGPVNTLHLLSEAADPEDAYEVWLSPEHYYLPVKLRFYAGRFPIELIATSIRSTP